MSDKPERQPRKTYQPDPHRLLPQAPDSEKGVLCSFLLAPNDVGGHCVELGVTEDWFAIPSHALIYRRLVEMWDKSLPVDFIMLTNYLRDHSELDQCGGAGFITELYSFLPTAANVGHYLATLEEKLISRGIIKVGTEFAARGYDEQDRVPELLDGFEQQSLAIRSTRATNTQRSTKGAVINAICNIEEMFERKGSISGLATGFHDFDRLTDGLHPCDLVVIAARPSQGKTALAMNMAEHIAIDLGEPVGVFSLEMSTDQLIQRMLCSRARVNLARVRDGYLGERDFPALQAAGSKISGAPLYIDEGSGMTIQQLRAKARRMKQKHKIRALFIDYLQLLRSNSKRAERDRQLEVAEISAGLKDLAKELGIPVVVLAQINRKFEERAMSGRPRLSDLRESGAIEQDADTVGFLVRQETYAENEEEKEELQGKADLIIAKQRHGPIGDVPLTFIKEYTRFENRAREGDFEPSAAPPLLEFPV